MIPAAESPVLKIEETPVLLPKPSWFAKAVYACLPVRRKTVLKNMGIVFGDRLSGDEIRRLAQSFYGHLFRVCMENIAAGFMGRDQTRRRIRIEGKEHLSSGYEKGRGILLLTGHFGNWEFAPVAGIMNFPELRGRFHVLRRRLVNKWVEKILFRRFYAAGLNVIPKKNSLGTVLECLANNDVVTFIMDQHAKPGKDGIAVEFFGKKAGTFKSLAVIARTTGAPVVPVFCYRDEDGRHVMRFSAPVPWTENADPDAEILENTRSYNKALEKMVLEKPDQWCWMHKRWKI